MPGGGIPGRIMPGGGMPGGGTAGTNQKQSDVLKQLTSLKLSASQEHRMSCKGACTCQLHTAA